MQQSLERFVVLVDDPFDDVGFFGHVVYREFGKSLRGNDAGDCRRKVLFNLGFGAAGAPLLFLWSVGVVFLSCHGWNSSGFCYANV